MIEIAEILKQVPDDFIEVVTSVSIGTMVSIMTIALPVVVSVIHNLSDRYQTNYVLTLFNKDWTLKIFRILLVLDLFLSTAWVICYYCSPQIICCLSVFLFSSTLLLVFSLILLIARMVYYAIPDKLARVVIHKINHQSLPVQYFCTDVYDIRIYRNNPKKERAREKQLKRIETYNRESTQLFVILAKLYVIFREDKSLCKNILEFWEDKCFEASKIDDNGIKRYADCYYNFIYEIADQSLENNNALIQKDAVHFVNALLKGHLGKPRKFGEEETAIHTTKAGMSLETQECLWNFLRRCVDCSNSDMFKLYWQRAHNFYSRKYQEVVLRQDNNPPRYNIEAERSIYFIVHFLCGAYLMGHKKYDLVEYILNYSQQVPFKWLLIPDNINDIISSYIIVKNWYSDWTHKEHFAFTEDYNLFSEMIVNNPIAQYANMLLFIVWSNVNDINRLELINNHQTTVYLKQLLNMVESSNEKSDWVTYLHIEEAMQQKCAITQCLKTIIARYEQPNQHVFPPLATKGTSNSAIFKLCKKGIVTFLQKIIQLLTEVIK